MKLRNVSILVLLSFLSAVPAAHAATYTVNQLGDTGTGQGFSGDLRYCITQANANSPGPNIIKFQAGLTGTINLTGALPDLMNKLTIQGPGANSLTVNGHSSRPFSVDGGATVFLSGLTLTGGVGNGAGLFIFSGGVLTLNSVAITGNVAPMGGVGGGIWNYGTLTINSSTISGNSAIADQYGSGYGGGIYNTGTLTVNNSTVSGNSASQGGGIFSGGKLALNNSTISANTAQLAAGGILVSSSRGTTSARNTIIAGNTGDVSGNLGSLGHNLIGNSNGGSGYAPSDLLNVDPKLGPLQNNGGPTLTHALLTGSPAINAGDNNGAPKWDQRGSGFPRIVNGVIDIGSFEVQ